jgi:hypothetical protein
VTASFTIERVAHIAPCHGGFRTEVPTLQGRFEADPEGGAFYAHSSDRDALDDLSVRLRVIAGDADRLREFVRIAQAIGFKFETENVFEKLSDSRRGGVIVDVHGSTVDGWHGSGVIPRT